MSIEKTLRRTEQSMSSIMSGFDNRVRATISQPFTQFHSIHKLSNSHSLKSLQNQSAKNSELQYENKLLRTQVQNLKKQLKLQRQYKQNEIYELEQQIGKLKSLIQKGYYSIKAIEKQNQKFKNDNYSIREKCRISQQRVLYLQDKTCQMIEYIKAIKRDHQKQVALIWQRVSHLQKNLQAVVQLIQQERNEDKNFKKTLRSSRNESFNGRSSKYC